MSTRRGSSGQSSILCRIEGRIIRTRGVADERVLRSEARDHRDSLSAVVGTQGGVLDVPALQHDAVADARSASLADAAVAALERRAALVRNRNGDIDMDVRTCRAVSPPIILDRKLMSLGARHTKVREATH